MRQAVLAAFAACDDHLFGIGVDHEIRIVGDQDDLTARFRVLEVARQQLVDGLIVEILVWLIDDQRSCIHGIEAEIQDQQDNPLRSRRKLFEVGTIVFEAVVEPNVVNLVEPFDQVLVGGVGAKIIFGP
jgi:hypothetical protein